MIVYIIKSTLIVMIVLGVYHLILEDEKMHRLNRIYLLFGLTLACIAPLITVAYVTPEAFMGTVSVISDISTLDNIVEASTSVSWSYTSILISIYIGGASIFLGRFIYNLILLITKMIQNPVTKYNGFRLVLIEENELPHTFFKYIFINREAFESNQIEEALFTHELAHAQQLHSFDVVLIELLQILFWFNPFMPLYKRAIQLNHEFLADDEVIQAFGCITDYQYLLIDKAAHNKRIYLASNLNFSVTKKRLKMMTKTSPKWRTYLYAGLILPLFICLLYTFGNEAHANSTFNQLDQKEIDKKEVMFKNATIDFANEDEKGTYKGFADLTNEQKTMIPLQPALPPVASLIEGNNSLPKGTIAEYNVQNDKVMIRATENDSIPPAPPTPPKPPTPPASVAHPSAPTAPSPPVAPVAPVTSDMPSKPNAHPSPPIAPTTATPPKPPAAPTPSRMAAPPKPPSPPAPPAPPTINIAELVKQIAQEGGTFYINGEEVDSDAALDLAQNEDDIATVDLKKDKDGSKAIYLVKK